MLLPAVTSKIIGDENVRNLSFNDFLSTGIMRMTIGNTAMAINGSTKLNSTQKEKIELAMIKNGLVSDDLITEFEDKNYEEKLPKQIKVSILNTHMANIKTHLDSIPHKQSFIINERTAKMGDFLATQSSWVGYVDYDSNTRVMEAILNGENYAFCDVSPQRFSAWKNASSKGQYFNKHIKGNYNC